MKGKTHWQERPYRPANQRAQLDGPLIVRLAPHSTGLEFEWLDPAAPEAAHRAYLREMDGGEPFREVPLLGKISRLEGLTPWRDYEICVTRESAAPSHAQARLFRAVSAPGTVVNYLHPKDDFYAFSGRSLCSPSIAKLPSGSLVASMDLFVSGGPQNLTLLFKSSDRGRNWRYLNDLHPCFWANLFVHNGRLYAMGCSTEFGDLVIGASDDEGETWTAPTHLFCGASTVGEGWEQAPMPLLRANGRLYTSVEYGRLPNVGICVVSAPEDADLLDPASWSSTPPCYMRPDWPGKPAGDCRMILEGNVLLDREGKLIDLLRVQATNCVPSRGVALVLSVDPNNPESALAFDKFLPMPSGSNSKTFIRYDKISRAYFAVGNVCVHPASPDQRNVLSLLVSKDAYCWEVAEHLIDFREERPGEVGFQYPFFLFDGDDMLLECRTAIGGARNFHDANFATFHVVHDFRKYAR